MSIIITDGHAKFYANWIISEHKLDLHECTMLLKGGYCPSGERQAHFLSPPPDIIIVELLHLSSCCSDLCFVDWTERYKCYRLADRLLEPAAGS